MANLSKSEIEHFVENLKEYPIEEVGSPAWLQQMMNIEKLNVCAHVQAASNQFEQVVDTINTFDKFIVLVHELLAAELWIKNCLPEIKAKSPQFAFARIFMAERSMTTLLNLIELIVFHPDELPSEGLLPLIDYCNRKMAVLANLDLSELTAKEVPEERKALFSLGFSCLSIIWCMASANDIALSVTKRLVAEDDVVLTLCELIMKQPWRTVKGGKVTKWTNGELKQLTSAESQRVCPPEAHAWTALQQLLEPRCLEMTKWNEHRKNIILQVEGMLSEVLIDQLPPLTGLRRVLQWLKVNEIPTPKFSAVVEQYPAMMAEFDQQRDWKAVTQKSLKSYFDINPTILQKEMLNISELFEIFAQ